MSLPPVLNFEGKRVLLKYHKLASGRGTAPPNSLPALDEVLEGGAEVVEFDVGRAADGFALLHDETLQRETTSEGPLRELSLAQVQAARLRGSEHTVPSLREVAQRLSEVRRPVKVQVDFKVLEPAPPEMLHDLLNDLRPVVENPHLTVVVGCLADWNLRALRRMDPELALGLDFAYYLDAPVDELVRLPTRLNAYGYLDDHMLGYRRLMGVAAYLQDRVQSLVSLVPDAAEFYLRKEFVQRALDDGFNPIEEIRTLRPDALIDVWTLDWTGEESRSCMLSMLNAGADQITTNTSLQWSEALA